MQSRDIEPNSKYCLEEYFSIAYSKQPPFIDILLLKLNPYPLVLELFLDPSLNLPNFLDPNHVLNTLVSPGYFLINAHLRHVATNHNHFYISVILMFIPQSSIC